MLTEAAPRREDHPATTSALLTCVSETLTPDHRLSSRRLGGGVDLSLTALWASRVVVYRDHNLSKGCRFVKKINKKKPYLNISIFALHF